jgi:hypothetical protein
MNLEIMYGQAWYWMEELCDIISPRLSIKSVILQVCDANHLAGLGGPVPKFVDFGCLTTLML